MSRTATPAKGLDSNGRASILYRNRNPAPLHLDKAYGRKGMELGASEGLNDDAAAYEARQVEHIRQFKQSYLQGGGRLARAWALLSLPEGWSFSKVVPVGAIEGALQGGMWLAEQWADKNGVLRDLRAYRFSDLSSYALSRLDKAADNIHDWAIAYGGGVGLANGLAGFYAVPLGIPGLINIALRTIRKIGLCYGYEQLDEIEKQSIFQVLSLAGGGGPTQKASSLLALQQLEVTIRTQTFKAMAVKAAGNGATKEAFVIGLRDLAKQIGLQLTRNRLLMAAPLVGGGIGLLVDGNYIRSVGWAARRTYQERWLRDRGRWPDDDGPIIEGTSESS